VTRSILEASDELIAETQEKLAKLDKAAYGRQSYILELLPRLQAQYSKSDPGNLVALLCMNYLVLSPGEAIYIPADGIHAYLSGDIVECMARSNNVLNTGFCPRADRDSVQLFSETMTFQPHSKEEVMLPSKKCEKGRKGRKGRTVVYRPPMSEFDMLLTELEEGEEEELEGFEGPGVMVVIGGSGTLIADGKEYGLEEGYVFYITPGTEVRYKARDGLTIYEAVV
jgi:mannose-6-phosphate isomerase